MKRKELQAGWEGLSNEIMADMAEWRSQHPKASLREIEGEIDKRLSELRARMITDTANASASAKWEKADGVVCPEMWSEADQEGEEEAGTIDAGGAGDRTGTGVWSVCCLRVGDFSPG